ncbi:hypothetical protein GCK32_007013, partial [Trichostrongylus colubriformis]
PDAMLPVRPSDGDLISGSSDYMPEYYDEFPEESPCIIVPTPVEEPEVNEEMEEVVNSS